MVREKERKMGIRKQIESLGNIDAVELETSEKSYGHSWKARGGVGAFMMLARKWDRIQNQCEDNQYDIFKTILKDMTKEGILDDIGDLRRYLFLVENEIRQQKGIDCAGLPLRNEQANNKSLGNNPKGITLEGTQESVAEEDFPNGNPYSE